MIYSFQYRFCRAVQVLDAPLVHDHRVGKGDGVADPKPEFPHVALSKRIPGAWVVLPAPCREAGVPRGGGCVDAHDHRVVHLLEGGHLSV
jgi:hypothetical protein